MRNFKLIVEYQNKYKRTITYFDNQSNELFHEPYSTFNEKLTESENDQYQLTFSIAGYIADHGTIRKNHWLDIIKLGTRLILEIDNGEIETRLIVSKVNPVPSVHNLIYSFTAQDEISYKWSKIRLGYSYSNIENDDPNRVGVETIYTITENVLKDNFLSEQWGYRDTEGVKDHPENALSNKPITLEVLDSNPYNVIIEACNTLGCYLKINYKEQYLTFYQKNDIEFSGYRYRPEVNLSTFSADYNMDEYASILHVVGGTNEYEEIVTLVPSVPQEIMDWLIANKTTWENTDGSPTNPELWTKDVAKAFTDNNDATIKEFLTIAKQVPHLSQFISDFSYFQKSKLISNDDYSELTDLFNLHMRNNNIRLKYYTPQRYRLQYSINTTLYDILLIARQSYGAEIGLEEPDTNKLEQYRLEIESKIKKDSYLLWKNMIQVHGHAGTIINSDYTKSYYPEIQEWIDDYNSYKIAYEKAQQDLSVEQGKQDENYGTAVDRITTLEKKEKQETITTNEIVELQNLRDFVVPIDSQIALLTERIDTYKSLTDANGAYPWLFQIVIDNYIPNNLPQTSQQSSLDGQIAKYEDANSELWKQIYSNYRNYIYEVKYENADELDSYSLYNQGITYFEKQRRPVAAYSMETLDIGVLELVDLPRLSIGSKIRVYNDKLNLVDMQLDANNKKIRGEDIISFNNNDLIVTQLTYDLRNPTKVQVSVEQVQPYNKIVSKLLQSVRL